MQGQKWVQWCSWPPQAGRKCLISLCPLKVTFLFPVKELKTVCWIQYRVLHKDRLLNHIIMLGFSVHIFRLQTLFTHFHTCDLWDIHVYHHIRYTSFSGPLLDDGLKWGTLKALKELPLSLLFCMSVSVCLSVNKLQVTATYNYGIWKKKFFFVVFRHFPFWWF